MCRPGPFDSHQLDPLLELDLSRERPVHWALCGDQLEAPELVFV
jgi:hypothetical protein